MIIVGWSASQKIAKEIAKKLKKPYYDLKVDSFPDGETHLRFTNNAKGKNVVLVQTLNNPNDKLIEVIFAAYTAKDLGAKKVTLVAPYMAYLRQDKRFHSGECVSNKIIAKLFEVFDEIITIDPHLHRIKSLGKLFHKKTITLTANPLLSQYIKSKIKNAAVIGPDAESFQWALDVAKSAGCKATVLKKKRYSSTTVRIKLHEPELVKGKNVVIVDDIISTGHTMMETIKESKRAGAKSIYCICVHGIYADNSLPKLRKMGAKVIATNTIEGETSKINVAELISQALKK